LTLTLTLTLTLILTLTLTSTLNLTIGAGRAHPAVRSRVRVDSLVLQHYGYPPDKVTRNP
jgi:hypothetical protein